MAYQSSAPARKILDLGFASTLGGSIFAYQSTHSHGEIEALNFFQGCGFGSPSSASIGLTPGDLLVHAHVSSQTSAVTWHRCVSISTSTGWHSPVHASLSVASS